MSEQTDQVKQIEEKTTIPLRKTTRNILKDFGKKGETWDALILRLCGIVKIAQEVK